MQSLKRRLQGFPPLFNLLRRTRRLVGRLLPHRRYTMIEGRVHNADWMFRGAAPEDYARIGQEALDLIDRALASGRPAHEPLRVIDYGAGFGRVTRLLARRYGPENVTVFDVDNETTAFCAREFGVQRVPFDGDWARLAFATYDVAWLGSVVTHLSVDYIHRTLASLRDMIAPDGVIVLTTMGEEGLRQLHRGRYGPRLQRNAEALVRDYRGRGSAFQAYAYESDPNVGIAWTSPERFAQIAESVGLQVTDCWLRAWDEHHDVQVLRHRSAESAPLSRGSVSQ